MMFWLIAISLGLLAGLFIFGSLLLPENSKRADRKNTNLSLFSERIADLDASLAQGDLNDQEHAELVLEAKKDLLQDTDLQGGLQENVATQVVGNSGSGRLLIIAAVLIPIFAVFLYADFGLGRGNLEDHYVAELLSDTDPEDRFAYFKVIEQLADRMRTQPDNIDGQYLLARAYVTLDLPGEAARVFGLLVKNFPMDANLASYYAETLFVANERVLSPEIEQAVAAALRLNPNDLSMLELQAIAAMTDKDYPRALKWFKRAKATGISGQRAELVENAIRWVENQLQTAGVAPDKPQSRDARSEVELEVEPEVESEFAAVVRSLRVSVKIADGLDLSPQAAVFIYARAVKGPPAPLAVQRVQVSQLPLEVTLDESMAMIAGMGMANFDLVQVIARISRTGQAKASVGDYEVKSRNIDLTQKTDLIELVIRDKISE